MLRSMLERGEYIRHPGMTIDDFLLFKTINVDKNFLNVNNEFVAKRTPADIADIYLRCANNAVNKLEQCKKVDVCIIGIYTRNFEIFKLVDRMLMLGCEANLIIWEPDTEWAQDPDQCYEHSDKKMPLRIVRSIADHFERGIGTTAFWNEYARYCSTRTAGKYFFGKSLRDLLEKEEEEETETPCANIEVKQDAADLAKLLTLGNNIHTPPSLGG